MPIILPPGVSLDEKPKEEPPEPAEPAAVEVAPPLLEPTKEEYEKANLAAQAVFHNLDSDGAQVAFFTIPEVTQLCTRWLEGSIGAIITNIVLADRQRIFQGMDHAIREQLKSQDIAHRTRNLDPKIAALLQTNVKLDPQTCTSLMMALTNIMGNTPAPRLKLNVGDPAEGENPPQPVQDESETPPPGKIIQS